MSTTADPKSHASVRKALAGLRRQWAAHAPQTPLHLSAPVDDGSATPAAEFCVRFLMAQKRPRREDT